MKRGENIMEEKSGINLNISDGNPFFAHEANINLNPTQFVFDFKCVTPRNDPRSKDRPSFQMMHNVIMIEPWHAKRLLEAMQNAVERFEKEYGKIQTPTSIIKLEKKNKKVKKNNTKKTVLSYLG